jgi:hypothetical protein
LVVLPALNDEGATGLEHLLDNANAALEEMVGEGAIRAQEREQMVVGTYPRRKRDLLAPFDRDGQFRQLSVERCELFSLADPAWADYECDGNKQALATKQALFFRSVFMPSLASALTRVRDGDTEALRAFADRLQNGLTRRLSNPPAPMHSFVETIVLAKRG